MKLIVFDMDGVLIKDKSSWITVHRGLGTMVIRRCTEIAEQYLIYKKFSYKEWCKRDIEAWGDVSLEQVKKIVETINYTKGAKLVCKKFKKRGYKLALISGGLNVLAEKIKEELDFDYCICNELIEKNGKLHVVINVETAKDSNKGKGKILENLIKKLNFKKQDIVVIGDTEADIPMMKLAGLSIAFNPEVFDQEMENDFKKYAVIIKSDDLSKILNYIKK